MAVLGWNAKLVTEDHFLDKVEADHFLKYHLSSFLFYQDIKHGAFHFSDQIFRYQVRNAEI